MSGRSSSSVKAVGILVFATTAVYFFILRPSTSSLNNTPAAASLFTIGIDRDEHQGMRDFYKSHLESQLKTSEEVWQRFVQKRKKLVGNDPSLVDPWPPALVMYFWDYFLPTFSCPYTIERIGGLGDGGKWVCGLELYETPSKDSKLPSYLQHIKPDKKCIVYSFGVAFESSFEAELLERTNCEIFAYDASVSKMGPQVDSNNPRVNFNKNYIGARDELVDGVEKLTLATLMERNGHDWINLLKMDVEGGEFDVWGQIMDEFQVLPFDQLFLEIHGDKEGKAFPQVYKLWERLEEKGIRAFKNEINHWPCVRARLNPIYIEYSFINVNKKARGKSRLLPEL